MLTPQEIRPFKGLLTIGGPYFLGAGSPLDCHDL